MALPLVAAALRWWISVPAWWDLTRRNTQNDGDYFEKEYLIKGRRHGKRFRLGDNVRVKVARINAFRSEIDFSLVPETGQRVHDAALSN